jgi:hypothetical protein
MAPPATETAARLRIATQPEWEAALAGFDAIFQEQMVDFARLRYPGMSLEPVLVVSGERILGGALMMVKRLPLGIASLAITKWGPVLKRASGGTADFSAVVDAITVEYADRRGMLVSIMPPPSPDPSLAEYRLLLDKGFRPGPQLRAPERYYADIRLDDEALRKNFAGKWRNQLNKAERSGITFEHARPEQFPEFAALFEGMLQRKQYVDHSALFTLPTLLGHTLEALRYELFLGRLEGEAVAGAVVVKGGEVATYLYAATSAKALPVNAGNFMCYNMIRWLRDNTRARWFNLGGTDGSEGLRTFKTGLIGKSGVVAPFAPAALYASRAWPRLIGTAAFAGRSALVRTRRAIEDFVQARRAGKRG